MVLGNLRPLILISLLVAMAAILPLPPVTAAPAASDPTVDEIVARHIAARGGLKKIRAIQTLREKGHVTAGANREALVTRELKRPSRTRFEFTLQGVTGVFVSDGQHGWRVSPFEGDAGPSPLPDEAVKEAAEQADIEGPLVDWKAKGHQVELAGRETVDGREAFKLKITLKSGAVRYEYLDVKSLYRVRADSTRQVRGHPVQIQTTFGDYKKTGGVAFPHLIEVSAVGRPQRLRVVLDSVEINPPLSDALFEMSESTQP
jgi:outer membrane lipoprotein-sorting protein